MHELPWFFVSTLLLTVHLWVLLPDGFFTKPKCNSTWNSCLLSAATAISLIFSKRRILIFDFGKLVLFSLRSAFIRCVYLLIWHFLGTAVFAEFHLEVTIDQEGEGFVRVVFSLKLCRIFWAEIWLTWSIEGSSNEFPWWWTPPPMKALVRPEESKLVSHTP